MYTFSHSFKNVQKCFYSINLRCRVVDLMSMQINLQYYSVCVCVFKTSAMHATGRRRVNDVLFNAEPNV